MSTSDDYQGMAEECFRRAQESQTDSERHGYLELARTWLEAASKMDCGPRRSPEAHSVKVVFTSRLAGLSPRIRLRSLVDFWPTKFTFALRLKSSDESLRPIR